MSFAVSVVVCILALLPALLMKRIVALENAQGMLLANPQAGGSALTNAFAKVRPTKLLRDLPHGLDEEIGENGVQLSGGQRQRLAITQALLHGCQILILDDVTSKLDEKTESEIADMLKALKEKENLIILCISHMPRILTYADRVMTIQMQGPPQRPSDLKRGMQRQRRQFKAR